MRILLNQTRVLPRRLLPIKKTRQKPKQQKNRQRPKQQRPKQLKNRQRPKQRHPQAPVHCSARPLFWFSGSSWLSVTFNSRRPSRPQTGPTVIQRSPHLNTFVTNEVPSGLIYYDSHLYHACYRFPMVNMND